MIKEKESTKKMKETKKEIKIKTRTKKIKFEIETQSTTKTNEIEIKTCTKKIEFEMKTRMKNRVCEKEEIKKEYATIESSIVFQKEFQKESSEPIKKMKID